jgi:hypothetical protein
MSGLISLGIYIFACWLVGHFGEDTKFRFWGNFAISFFLTPIVGLVVLLAQDKRPKEEAEA